METQSIEWDAEKINLELCRMHIIKKQNEYLFRFDEISETSEPSEIIRTKHFYITINFGVISSVFLRDLFFICENNKCSFFLYTHEQNSIKIIIQPK